MIKKCCSRKRCIKKENRIFGIILISLGMGLFLAYIIPRYFLITILGLAFIVMGICCIVKK